MEILNFLICPKKIIKMEGGNDKLNFANDPYILDILRGEDLLYSDTVYKKNRFGWKQERNLIISNKAVYNLKKKGKSINLNLLILT